MKKYLMILSVMAFVACNNSKKVDEQDSVRVNRDNEVRQKTIDSIADLTQEKEIRLRTIDSMETVNNKTNKRTNIKYNTTNTETNVYNAPAKKRMSNKTKGVLIGTGVGIISGAAIGAATSEDKGKAAGIGCVIGGAVGAGTGYGIGAKKDNKDAGK